MYSKPMMMHRFTLLVMLLGIWLHAQTLAVGELYTGPMKLSAPNLGASLMLPSGWEAQLVSQRGPLVLQSREDSSRILMEANVSVTGNPAAMLGEKLEYYGLELFSATQIKQMRTSLYYRLYQVRGSDTFTQALLYVVVGSQGRAILLYGFFDLDGYVPMRQTMMTLSDTMGFTPIRALPHQMTQLYLQLASGHFVFYEKKGSFSEKRELWLCRDGRAFLRGSYAVANTTSRQTVQRRGSWSLDGDRLVLELSGGFRQRYRVSKENNTLLFDGAQTFRLPNHACE